MVVCVLALGLAGCAGGTNGAASPGVSASQAKALRSPTTAPSAKALLIATCRRNALTQQRESVAFANVLRLNGVAATMRQQELPASLRNPGLPGWRAYAAATAANFAALDAMSRVLDKMGPIEGSCPPRP